MYSGFLLYIAMFAGANGGDCGIPRSGAIWLQIVAGAGSAQTMPCDALLPDVPETVAGWWSGGWRASSPMRISCPPKAASRRHPLRTRTVRGEISPLKIALDLRRAGLL